MANINITEAPLKPYIKRYTDVYAYLTDYYQFRKDLDDHFSYELWAAELGFKSRIFMYLICQRKRPITIQFVEKFSAKAVMSENEKNHFLLLASFERIKSQELKTSFYDKILESKENNENFFNAKDYFKFFSSKTIPLVKMILAFDDTKGTVSELSDLLNTSAVKIQNDLNILENLEFATKAICPTTNEVSWKATFKAFRISEDSVTDTALKGFHHRVLQEAQEMNQTDDVFKKFRTTQFAVNPEQHADIQTDVENFIAKMKNKYGYNELNEKHLMQMNLQMYPVSNIYKK